VALGHHGGVPSFTTPALRNTAGQCVIRWQNGYDAHDSPSSVTPFVQAALSG
jgi:hypothetical protein